MRAIVRVVLILALCVPCAVGANPLLLAPTGTTLTTGQFRVEAALSPGNEHGKYMWFATGLFQLEGSLIRFEPPGEKAQNIFGAQWCFLPETFITPAVSFGVRDVAGQTDEGVAGYFAVTKHVATEGVVPVLREFSATLGLGVGGLRGPFASFEAKLPMGFFVQGEYDSRNLNGAFGWQPTSIFRLKAYSIRHDTYFGAELLTSVF